MATTSTTLLGGFGDYVNAVASPLALAGTKSWVDNTTTMGWVDPGVYSQLTADWPLLRREFLTQAQLQPSPSPQGIQSLGFHRLNDKAFRISEPLDELRLSVAKWLA